MLHVGVEDGGEAQQCMVCPLTRTEPHDALVVILWDNALPVPRGLARRTGAVLRLCPEHADELVVLLLEVL